MPTTRSRPLRFAFALAALLALAAAAAFLLSRPQGSTGQVTALIPAAHAEELIPAPPPSSDSAAVPALGPVALLPVDRWLASGEYAWRAEETPPGPVTIVVDLRARTLSVYSQGVEIGRSSVVYGYEDKPTPLGTFQILQKKADHVSNLYNAPMPWMLRLTWDGVAIHGSEMADDKATHGCIGLPDEFAERLFGMAEKGGRVIVNNGPPARADYSAYAALPYGASL
jgi:lipoprotein-anchoring transpeptidase ErfK/SrfK